MPPDGARDRDDVADREPPRSTHWCAAEDSSNQARHDARLEDASARSADEGRWSAAKGKGSGIHALSLPCPNGATPPTFGWRPTAVCCGRERRELKHLSTGRKSYSIRSSGERPGWLPKPRPCQACTPCGRGVVRRVVRGASRTPTGPDGRERPGTADQSR